ncbi:hypothetical protein PHAVU_007G074400 [Phaseolus vulgaris]|uniref:Uncharacterized protein n=1 Tax=Phaseolus vulgaris TaxID=3885 RepID=V7BC64_PHAVU|nr:hypothetical protein PHAVU_007G074400g [Phaseolus vulgaris]ESW15462.1 hypothetical protein PHAVU_007G074400g [Phaseolus vulgaris]
MSQESGTAIFSATSPSDVHVRDPIKRLKISYTREFLLSLDQADIIVKFPYAVDDEEADIFSLRLCVPGRMSTCDPSEAYISPISVEKGKQVVSMTDDCESSTFCRGISVSMKQNPSSPDFHIQRELKLNSFSGSIDGKSSSSCELCLPDEDSLITFDELFLLPDVENLAVVDSSMSSGPERSPSSPREMIEKLVEFILNEESSTPHVEDPTVQHGAGLGCFSHSTHAQQSHVEFCSNHLTPERKDQLDHNRFQINSIDSAIHSFFSHSFPSN